MLYRRVDIQDAVTAHLAAVDRADDIGFGKYIISATTPFSQADLAELRVDAPTVVRRYFPNYAEVFESRAWKMFPSIERVYANQAARTALGWAPRYDFQTALDHLRAGQDFRSPLGLEIGAKGYHEGSVHPYTSR